MWGWHGVGSPALQRRPIVLAGMRPVWEPLKYSRQHDEKQSLIFRRNSFLLVTVRRTPDLRLLCFSKLHGAPGLISVGCIPVTLNRMDENAQEEQQHAATLCGRSNWQHPIALDDYNEEVHLNGCPRECLLSFSFSLR
ncbi:hypothetical protein CEXT_63771 [Caerostris extrusa]|uniref:Uncharacterized protein n=1 Tax=Caerostris extrusa TaxID=172846 RepID=A0AAV4QDP0_CAEEX|nr:hypothetical protein CEXT_63771 [Caerostris extrusa]